MYRYLFSVLGFMFFMISTEATPQNTQKGAGTAMPYESIDDIQREPAARKKRRKRRKRGFKKRVTVDFEDELIEGSATSPNIFHLFHKKQLNYGRLIKLRKNFLPEMRRTAREIAK